MFCSRTYSQLIRVVSIKVLPQFVTLVDPFDLSNIRKRLNLDKVKHVSGVTITTVSPLSIQTP